MHILHPVQQREPVLRFHFGNIHGAITVGRHDITPKLSAGFLHKGGVSRREGVGIHMKVKLVDGFFTWMCPGNRLSPFQYVPFDQFYIHVIFHNTVAVHFGSRGLYTFWRCWGWGLCLRLARFRGKCWQFGMS
ncbi:hypothetical protein D3C74_374090 [compost metagenome]